MFTIQNELFLQADKTNKNNPSQRFMIFTTTANLKYLSEALYWIMDGTFAILPEMFSQLYIIHAPVRREFNSKVFPLVYILINGKSQNLYTRIFQEVKSLIIKNNFNIKTKYLITDFEKAVLNASKHIFKFENKGCHFHLAQNIWKHIQQNNLTNIFKKNTVFRILIKSLIALAFLKPKEILKAFNQLKVKLDKVCPKIC